MAKIRRIIDMAYRDCFKCSKGHYIEASQMDDMDGAVHCFECGHKMPRYKPEGHTIIVFGNLGDKTCFLDISVEEAKERYEKMCGKKNFREPYIFEFNDSFRAYDVWDDEEK